MTGAPDPLVPAEVDLREFQYMELDVRRLRDSRFAVQVSGDAFRAGLLLWCAAWHQVPAASVLDDDVELANLAGFGRFIKEFRRLKAEALHGWVLCSDGRWYHPVVAEKALAAWHSKLRHAYGKMEERVRKMNKRRAESKLPTVAVPSFDAWCAAGRADPVPPESAGLPPEQSRMSSGIPPHVPPEEAGPSGGIPPEHDPPGGGIPTENALKWNGTERNGTDIPEKNTIVVIGDATAQGKPSDDDDGGAHGRHRRAIGIVRLLRSRQIGVTAANPDVLAWAEEGFTDDQILDAVVRAVESRAAARSRQPITSPFPDTILRNAGAGRAGDDDTRRREIADIAERMRREEAASAGR